MPQRGFVALHRADAAIISKVLRGQARHGCDAMSGEYSAEIACLTWRVARHWPRAPPPPPPGLPRPHTLAPSAPMDAAQRPSGLSCSAITLPACGGMSFLESASRFHTRALWSADAVAANLRGG